MIFKSYLVEENLKILKNAITLFYGENLGLIDDFRKKIVLLNKSETIIRYTQNDILKDKYIFFQKSKMIHYLNRKNIFYSRSKRQVV